VQTALARLANTPFPPLRYVGCEFDRGTLTLHGRVPTFYLKQVAQEAVRAVSGVRQVMNEIQVGP
jgi:osmotically-inducible protein OsmY